MAEWCTGAAMPRGIAASIDALLKPEGFEMREAAWNRQAGRLTDVVTLQIDKISQEATINLGVLDPVAFTRCWNRPVPDFVEEFDCTVRPRLGQLVDGRDHWWSLDQPEIVGDVVHELRAY